MKRIWLITVLFCLFQPWVGAQPGFFPFEKKGKAGYYAASPGDSVRGMLLLIPGYGQTPEMLLQDSVLLSGAATHGLALLAVNRPAHLLLTPESFRLLTSVFEDAARRFKAPPDKLAIGGFAEGGILAIQYTAECWSAAGYHPLRPAAVFGVETPVELSEWWKSLQRDQIRRSSPEAMAESAYWLDVLSRELGGAPDTLESVYRKRSPYHLGDGQPGKEQFLLSAGVRLYYFGDLQWQLGVMHRELSDLPATPASVLIKRLLLKGHPDASLVFTPDTWGDKEKNDCLQWVAESMGIGSRKE